MKSSSDASDDFENDSTEAVDIGFDFVNFPNLSVDEQIASIPPEFLVGIEFEQVVSQARSHPTCKVM